MALILAGLAFGVLPPGTAPKEQVIRSGEVTGRLTASADRIALAEELEVTLVLEGPAPLQVELAGPLVRDRNWRLAAGPVQLVPLADGRQRWQQTFRLDPRLPSDPGQPFRLELAELRYRRDGRWEPVPLGPLQVEVLPPRLAADLGRAREVPPIEAVPPSIPRWSQLPWLAGAAGAAAGLSLLAWGLRRRRAAAPEPSPHLAALAELDRINGLGLIAAGEGARFHTLVAAAIRVYIHRRFDLPADLRTTPEFLAALPNPPPWSAEAQAALCELLERCDLAKFSGRSVSSAECQAAGELAREFVRQTEGQSPNTSRG